MEYYVVFHSTHHLLQAERLCRASGTPITLVPIPRQITSDCGLAIKFGEPHLQAVISLVAGAGISHAGIYKSDSRGISRIEM